MAEVSKSMKRVKQQAARGGTQATVRWHHPDRRGEGGEGGAADSLLVLLHVTSEITGLERFQHGQPIHTETTHLSFYFTK